MEVDDAWSGYAGMNMVIFWGYRCGPKVNTARVAIELRCACDEGKRAKRAARTELGLE